MANNLKNEIKTARALLTCFACNGFKKTSMEDLGTSTGVSRQSIYKKFGSKKKCYEWSIRTYLTDMYGRMFKLLSSTEEDSFESLINVFDIFIGEGIEVAKCFCGAEVVNDVLAYTHASEEDWPLRLRARMTDFLIRNSYASVDKATGISFALISAGKGLLLEENSRKTFREDMTFIIESIVRTETERH